MPSIVVAERMKDQRQLVVGMLLDLHHIVAECQKSQRCFVDYLDIEERQRIPAQNFVVGLRKVTRHISYRTTFTDVSNDLKDSHHEVTYSAR